MSLIIYIIYDMIKNQGKTLHEKKYYERNFSQYHIF